MGYQLAAPASKAKEIMETLRLMASAEDLDDFSLRKLERDAAQLKKADAASAYMVLGAVAALRGNVEDVRRHHRASVTVSGGSTDAYRNYVVSLAAVGEMDESFNVASEAYKRFPGDAAILADVIDTALWSARFREGRDLCRHWKRSFPDEPPVRGPMMTGLADAVDSGVFSEGAVQEVIRIAHDIRRASNIRLMKNGLSVDHTEPDAYLYELYVIALPEQAAALNEDLASRVVARPDLLADPGLNFVPIFIGTRTDAGHADAAA
jgi:hypothetical protein